MSAKCQRKDPRSAFVADRRVLAGDERTRFGVGRLPDEGRVFVPKVGYLSVASPAVRSTAASGLPHRPGK